MKYVVPTNDDFRGPMMNARPGPYDRPAAPGFGAPRPRGRGGMLGPGGFPNGGTFPRGGRGSGGPMRGGGRSVGQIKGGQGQGSTTGHMIHMRGLPFEATVSDIYQFFAPLNPVEVRLTYEESGRPKGECDVDFATHADCEAAMSKDKQNMGHRYIELFLKSTVESSNGWPTSGAGTNNGAMLPQLNQRSPVQTMNGDGGNGYGNPGYGSGYGTAPSGGSMGNVAMGAGNYGAVGTGAGTGNYSNGTSNYSSFTNNGSAYPNIAQSAGGGNYYSSMR